MGGFITLMLFQMLGAPPVVVVAPVNGTWLLPRRGETYTLPVRETTWTPESRPIVFTAVRTN